MKNHKQVFEALLKGEILTDKQNIDIFLADDGLVYVKNKDEVKMLCLSTNTTHLTWFGHWSVKKVNYPEPIRLPPLAGTKCYIPSFECASGHTWFIWPERYDSQVWELYSNGMVHLSAENATLHSKYLMGVSNEPAN
jgi:hypothetical protein